MGEQNWARVKRASDTAEKEILGDGIAYRKGGHICEGGGDQTTHAGVAGCHQLGEHTANAESNRHDAKSVLLELAVYDVRSD